MVRFKAKRAVIFVVVTVFIIIHLCMFYYQHDSDEINNREKPDEDDYLMAQYIKPTVKPTTSLKLLDEKDKSNMIFTTLEEAHLYMRSITDLRKAYRIIIQYSNFSRHLPKFITEDDFEVFKRSDRNTGNLAANKYELLRGVVEVVPDATFKMDYECGFKSNSDYLKVPREASQSYDILVPLVIPMGFLFQHFFDGTLPKVIQAFEFIKKPNVKILMERPLHNNVYRILEKLGITLDKIVWHQRSDSTTVYHANQMIFTCVTPPLHPLIWKQIRHVLGVKDRLSVPFSDSYVIYLTRSGATNGGRNAINEGEVIDYLTNRYKARVLVFRGKYDFSEAIDVFNKVGIIIGTHGGAFYNLNYAPKSTHVVEFVPVLVGGRDIPSLPHAIFWAMADMIGQTYWRVQSRSQNFQHDMAVDIKKLGHILDNIDQLENK